MENREVVGAGETHMLSHDPNQPPLKGWHLDKRISVAHILATLSMAGALATVIWALEQRVTLTEQNIEQHKAITSVQHEAINEQIEAVKLRDVQLMNEWLRQNGEILRRLERIEDGVNRHIEQSMRGSP